jgi:hypothetical protein
MPQIEWSNDGTPWILLAIYVVLVGQSVASSSPLTDLTSVLSWIPALIGVYLTVRPYYANPSE